jgi:hypothetical protein
VFPIPGHAVARGMPTRKFLGHRGAVSLLGHRAWEPRTECAAAILLSWGHPNLRSLYCNIYYYQTSAYFRF